MTTKRKHYTKEFKHEAVRLLEQDDKSSSDIARVLGIKRNQLYKWQDEVHTTKKGSVTNEWHSR